MPSWLHHHRHEEEKPSAMPEPSTQPPSYDTNPSSPPPAGLRTPCSTSAAFPDAGSLGPPPFSDVGGEPVFVCSVIMGDSVHPGKAAPHLSPPVRVSWGGGEIEHHGRYDILPITDEMEWVPTSHGHVPQGRRPVEGGYEADGRHLWHAAAVLGPNHDDVRLPGKTATHLNGANFAFGGTEVVLRENYEILCWR